MPLRNAVESTATTRPRPSGGLRLDIQALRAVAVLLVVADHLGLLQRLPGHLHGGFIGVDVFFVISGFLITGHLLREITQTGKLSFRSFYARRARRILPAATFVLLVSMVAAFVVFWPGRAWASATDAIWALLFASNINFAAAGTDYFSAGQASIFQHYWSLSVEEQFYLVWPLLTLAAVWVARRRGTRIVPTVTAIVIGVGLISFIFACLVTLSSPSASYFSTPARVFEFCAGALVAVVAEKLQGLLSGKTFVMKATSLSGLFLIALSVLVIDPSSSFPGPWAALPAFGAAVFIAAGTGVDGGVRLPILNTRAVSYVGSVSYSIYLWHWPVIVLSAALIPQSVTLLVVTVASTSILSVLTYHFVERPFLVPTPAGQRMTRRKWHPMPATLKPLGVMVGGLVLVAAITAGATLMSTGPATLARTGSVLTAQEQRPESQRLLTDIQSRISDAAIADTWEGLSPSVDAANANESVTLTENCWNGRDETQDHCIMGDPSAPNTLAVLGDSIAMNWAPALWTIVKDRPSWNLAIYAKVGCPYAAVSVYDTDGSLYETCDQFRTAAVDAIRESRPEVLLLASALKKSLPGASTTAELTSKWERGVGDVADELADIDRVIAIAPPPEGRDILSCSNKFTRPSDCASEISGMWRSIVDATDNVLASKGRPFADTGLWFCSPNGICPATIGHYQVRADTVHMTQEYAQTLAPILASWLFP